MIRVLQLRTSRVSGIYQNLPVMHSSRRWFDWDPSVTRKDGKPAITGSRAAYVARDIPVVLLRDVAGLGTKGSIVEVRRGYARNVLIPQGSAVYGTLWENIDAYADPDVIRRKSMEESVADKKSQVPFDWLNDIKLNFIRTVDPSGKLDEPISVSEILQAVSAQEQVDLLPSQLTVPGDSITTVGRHDVTLNIQWTLGSHSYSFKVDVKDKEEVASAERREAELREAMKLKRPDFVLGSHKSSPNANDAEGDSDTDSDDDFNDLENNRHSD